MGMHNFENYDNEPGDDDEKRLELIVSGDTQAVNLVDVEMITCATDDCEFV